MSLSHISDYFRLLRPRQWLKNIFVALPIIFGGRLIEGGIYSWLCCFATFVAFSLASSSIYCINDVADRNYDAAHPVKRFRPVAAGRISKSSALFFSSVLIMLSVALCFVCSMPSVAFIISVYWLMNILYSLRLKHVPVLDVFIIATGFVLRVFAGGEATHIHISPWMVCLTFILTLFLAWAKRRGDFINSEINENNVRRATKGYNLQFMNSVTHVLASVTIVCYIMFTLSDDQMERINNEYVYLTSVFVIAGIVRYLQIIFTGGDADQPERTLSRDKFILACILLWLASYLIILYL